MQLDKIEDVLSENLGEGYRIVRDNDELSPIIEWVDWVNQSENDENEEAIRVEVHFEDGTEETFEKGITLRQIWHEVYYKNTLYAGGGKHGFMGRKSIGK